MSDRQSSFFDQFWFALLIALAVGLVFKSLLSYLLALTR